MERTYIHTHITAIIERKELFIDVFNRTYERIYLQNNDRNK